MTEKHSVGPDGILEDGVGYRLADRADLQTYDEAQRQLAAFRMPVLLPASDPDVRLYVACFDGTGNNATRDPEHASNVARVYDELHAQRDARVGAGYMEGIGTQSNPIVRLADGAIGFSYDDKLERMYLQFSRQVFEWKRENPDADIRIAELGFSRGGEEAAGFTRMVAERGVQDPSGAVREHGVIHYTKPPLVELGRVAQVLIEIDPVGTGAPRLHDRRPAPSVIAGVQFVARDEARNLFQSTSIMDPGATADGRFLSVTIAGAHSNLGDTYHHNGLGVLTGNMVTDAVNALSDTPLLAKRALPERAEYYAIHRSQETLPIYRTSVFDAHHERGRVDALAPRGTPGDRFNAEPRDEALASRFEFRPVAIGPLPAETPKLAPPSAPAAPPTATLGDADRALHGQALAGVRRLDTQLGRTSDAASDRVAAALLPVAREAGLRRIDNVVRSDDGRYLFAVEGELTSPTNRWARVDAGVAANTPVETSMQALRTLNAEIERRGNVAIDAPGQSKMHEPPSPPARTIGAL
ncbi:XVIPCD domain-containing protein [Lysobacter claricitrinus]|uniref:XVIPCD domain-containing protein n=1 Tax=Lysobacter claricitrinus TaxID=3367728 RepID=UPI0037DB09CA